MYKCLDNLFQTKPIGKPSIILCFFFYTGHESPTGSRSLISEFIRPLQITGEKPEQLSVKPIFLSRSRSGSSRHRFESDVSLLDNLLQEIVLVLMRKYTIFTARKLDCSTALPNLSAGMIFGALRCIGSLFKWIYLNAHATHCSGPLWSNWAITDCSCSTCGIFYLQTIQPKLISLTFKCSL